MNELVIEKPEAGDQRTQTISECPLHGKQAGRIQLKGNEELFFPMHKRVITQYSTDPSGVVELHLYHEDKDVSFDEPELFAFGERLGQQSRFVAETATTWGDGYNWPRIKELLEDLIEEGILQLADTAGFAPVKSEACQVNLLPGQCREPRTWFECEAITAELTGHPLELAYLELVVPIFRVAHIALDMEGRQVGEANVFPDRLRLDIPTDWTTCPFPGSRYQNERPMNVTALKSMKKHWLQTMAVLSKIREAYLRRFLDARQGLTLGHLECLSTLVLAVPAYLLMRSENTINNGSLHPVLSNMFRVTDGVRMTTHQMMIIPVAEATLPPETPVTSSEIYQYAERNHVFQSAHGVCGGPKVMIEEFLTVLVDGKSDDELAQVEFDAEVQDALDTIESALDYGLYGLQVYVIGLSFWTLMYGTYEQLWTMFETWPESDSTRLNEFKRIIQTDVKTMQSETLLATQELRSNRDRVQGYLFEKTTRGLMQSFAEKTLSQHLSPLTGSCQAEAETVLRAALKQRVGKKIAANAAIFDSLLDCLMNYLRQEQAIVKAACESQRCVNQLLGRPAPKREFTAADINLYSLLIGDVRKLPLISELFERVFNLSLTVTQNTIEISERNAG